jgi:hypothetical protein
MVTEAVAVQPELSLTVMLYDPDGKPEKTPVVFVWLGAANVYVNGAVPPEGVTVKLPVEPPLHNTLDEAVTEAVGPLLFNSV